MALTVEEEIVSTLRRKNLLKYPYPTQGRTLDFALWALALVQDEAGDKKVTAKALQYIISELAEKHLKEKAIIRAFAPVPGYTRTFREKGKCYYSLAGPGRKAVRDILSQQGDNSVLFFTGKEAWTDSHKLAKLLEQLKGPLCIVDTYYGAGTLQILNKFGKGREIRFLTGKLGPDEQKLPTAFQSELNRFKRQFPKIQLRGYPDRRELHDRYIISHNALVLIGHGLKDASTKESFVVTLPAEKVGGFMKTLKDAFENRWKRAKPL